MSIELIPICWVEPNIELSNKCEWQNKFWMLWSSISLEDREKFVKKLRSFSFESSTIRSSLNGVKK